MATRIYKVYESKTGVLHVSNKQIGQDIYTFGAWKNGKVRGACRTLNAANLTRAGVVKRIDDTWSYSQEDS